MDNPYDLYTNFMVVCKLNREIVYTIKKRIN